MAIIKEFKTSGGKDIDIVLGDVKTFNFTAKDSDGNPFDISAYGIPKYGVKSNIPDTSFIVNGNGVLIDDGSVALRGRFDVVINFNDAAFRALFGATDQVIFAWLEVVLVDDSANDQTPAQYPILVNRDIVTN